MIKDDELIELDDGTEVPTSIARITVLCLDGLNSSFGFEAIVNFLAICNGELDRFYGDCRNGAEELCLLYGLFKSGANGKHLHVTDENILKVANSCVVQQVGSSVKIIPPQSLQIIYKRWQGQDERAKIQKQKG